MSYVKFRKCTIHIPNIMELSTSTPEKVPIHNRPQIAIFVTVEFPFTVINIQPKMSILQNSNFALWDQELVRSLLPDSGKWGSVPGHNGSKAPPARHNGKRLTYFCSQPSKEKN